MSNINHLIEIFRIQNYDDFDFQKFSNTQPQIIKKYDLTDNHTEKLLKNESERLYKNLITRFKSFIS
jgi:hypothetical protein